MTIYTYSLRNRPAMYGTVPDKRRVDLDTAAPLPYGTVSYERPLTPREIYSFELIPVSPDPVLPLYPAGSQVKDMRNGKVYTVESFDGEYWIRDDFMRTIRDWLFYEPYAPALAASDNDYDWQSDANLYPFDTVIYEPDPFFPVEDNEIVTQYLDGTLQVIVSRNLNKHQIYHFCVDVQRAMGIKTVELDNEAQFSSGYTAFVCTFRQGVLRDIEAIRVDVKAYVQGFLDRLAALPPEPIAPPEPVTLQLSLF